MDGKTGPQPGIRAGSGTEPGAAQQAPSGPTSGAGRPGTSHHPAPRNGPPGLHRHAHRHPVRFAPSWVPPTDRHPPPMGGGANRTGGGARAVPGDGSELGKGPNRRVGGKTGLGPGIRVEPEAEPGAAPEAPRRGPSRRWRRPGLHTAQQSPAPAGKGLDLPGPGISSTRSRGGPPDASCQAPTAGRTHAPGPPPGCTGAASAGARPSTRCC